jgi:Escherichia/Staphylococcus phage prohead protease
MKREYRANPGLELRQDLGEPLKIRGYAAVFNQLSEVIFGFRERILPGAFKKSLGNDVRALVNHDPAHIIGRTKNGTLTLREDDRGLYTEISPPNTTLGHDTVESIKRGDLDQMSFGFQIVKDDWKHEERQLIREIHDVELFDVSIVAFPAYPQTSVAVRSLWPDGVPEEIEKAKQEAGKQVVFRVLSAAAKRIEELEQQYGINPGSTSQKKA